MKKIEAWQASDGTMHETEKQCSEYERREILLHAFAEQWKEFVRTTPVSFVSVVRFFQERFTLTTREEYIHNEHRARKQIESCRLR